MGSRRHTSHACDRCRSLRTKCSGGDRCAKCEKDNAVCVYGDRKRETNKKKLAEGLDRVRSLEEQNQRLISVMQRLLSSTNLPPDWRSEVEDVCSKVQDADEAVDSTTSKVQTQTQSSQASTPNNEEWDQQIEDQEMTDTTYPEIRHQSPPRRISWSAVRVPPNMSGPSRFYRATQKRLLAGEDLTGPQYPPAAWTSATTNGIMVQHLLALYFCWEYPTFATLSKEHFLVDFNSGRRRFCSSLLVNAILAIGARFSDFPEVKDNSDDPASAGDQFFREAQRLLGLEEVPTVTTIQALNLMSIRQAGSGKDMSSWHYTRYAMRIAIDLGLPNDDPNQEQADDTPSSRMDRQVRVATFWGCFALEQAWSLCIGRVPQMDLTEITVQKPLIVDEIEWEEWVPYTDEGLALNSVTRQESNVRLVFKCFSELGEIVHNATVLLYSDKPILNSHKLLEIYTQYLQWYDNLPDQLRLGGNSTPIVLFTHMYFHSAVLMLFRHFADLRLIHSPVSPRSICSEAAKNILSLIKVYRDLYTLRRIPMFVPYLILTAEIVRMMEERWLPTKENRSQDIDSHESMDYLKDLATPHLFARRATSLCNFFKERWAIQDLNLSDATNEHGKENTEGDEKSELSFPEGQTFFRPDDELGRHHQGGAGRHALRGPSAPGLGFHPFPLQGHPLRKVFATAEMDVGKESFEASQKILRAYGFEIIRDEHDK